MDIGSL